MKMDWVSASTVLLVILIAYLASKLSKRKKYPPGPKGLPFLGNILSFGNQPHLALLKWRQKFGDIFTMHIGSEPLVVLSDINTIRKVFAVNTAIGRENPNDSRRLAGIPDGSGLIFSEGHLWKTQRRFALSTLRDLGMGKNWLEDTILKEIEELCRILQATKETPINPEVQLRNSVSNVICALIFGERFDLRDPDFSRLTSLISEDIECARIDTIIKTLPFLLWFPNPVQKKKLRAREIHVELVAFMRQRIALHDKHAGEDADKQDYLSAYRHEKETASKTEEKATFSETQLLASLFDLFGAGTETTATSILWAFILMIENPNVVKEIQAEIDEKVGRNKMLTNSDRGLLSYTEAAVLEVQRVANLVPLGGRIIRERMTIDGHDIPKDTQVIANLYSIHHDPRWWKNPEEFDPNRFLDENRRLIKPEGFVPFSVGKRACLGEALAKMELFLFIANLLRCFSLKLPPGKSVSHNDCISGNVNSPLPFELIFVPQTEV